MWKAIDQIFWWLVWFSAAGCWIGVQFFDWRPDPKYLMATTFLALQFAASAKIDLFGKADARQ